MLVATKVKMSGSEKKSEQIHIQHFLHKMFKKKFLSKSKKFLEVSCCSNAKQWQRNVQKSLLHMQSCFLLITGLLIFRPVAEPRNSGKPAKSREIHKNTQNITKFGKNLTCRKLAKFMSKLCHWNGQQTFRNCQAQIMLRKTGH